MNTIISTGQMDPVEEVRRRAPAEAAEWLAGRSPEEAAAVLGTINPMVAQQILDEADDSQR